MNYNNWISYRYFVASKGRFLTFLNIISIVGIAIGVCALIVVTGVMTGFGNNLREKIIGTTPHVMVEKETGLKNYSELQNKINAIEGVKSTSAYIQGNIFLEYSSKALGLVIRGIDPTTENDITKVDQYLIQGQLTNLEGDSVIIGNELARYFGFSLDDTITLISPGSGISGEGWRYQLKIVGIFNTGMSDYDMNLILVNLKKAQEIYNFPENVSTGIGISTYPVDRIKKFKNVIYGSINSLLKLFRISENEMIKLYKINNVTEIKNEIYSVLGYSFLVKTWIDINHNLFEALFLEKWGLFIILTFMVLVAAFNIISTLIVTVTTKIHDIGILQSIVATYVIIIAEEMIIMMSKVLISTGT